jgi:hypothetical protein
MPWLRWLLTVPSSWRPGSVHVGFVIDKVALRQVFLTQEFFSFPLSVSLYHGSLCSYIIWGMNNRPIGGHSSETQSHPIYMNNNVLRDHNFINFVAFHADVHKTPVSCNSHLRDILGVIQHLFCQHILFPTWHFV